MNETLHIFILSSVPDNASKVGINISISIKDEKLKDLSSAEAMKLNGWRINAKYSMNSKYRSRCGDKTWYGYNYGFSVGSAQASFEGTGAAKLSYRNCYQKGQVIVYLNNQEISRATAYESKKEVTFNYSKGDTLLIKEVNIGIIKLNSLDLSPLEYENDSSQAMEENIIEDLSAGEYITNSYTNVKILHYSGFLMYYMSFIQ